MAISLDETTFASMLKRLYPGGVPYDMAMKNHPYLAMMAKMDEFEGSTMEIPIYVENPVGVSADFATAQLNADPSDSVHWSLPIKRKHGIVLIDALTIRKSRSNVGAFVRARQTEIDMLLQQMGNMAAHNAFRDSGGSLGRANGPVVGAGPTVDVTLTQLQDTRFFALGQKIVFGDPKDGSAIAGVGAGDVGTVTAINETTGTITFGSVASPFVPSAAVLALTQPYLFVQGDNAQAFNGLDDYIPLFTPGTAGVPATLNNIDRSVRPERLAGQRRTTPATSIKENILRLSEEIVRQGGNADYCFLSHTKFSDLITDLGSQLRYERAGGTVNWGWGYVDVYTSSGVIRVVADADCPENVGYVLDMSTWRFYHLDGFPHVDTLDGNEALRQAAADGLEVRARYWGNGVCIAPGRNGVMQLQ